tara:strand:+ start:74507 stop:75613 length:1107 start_codon:yes stop_codon:yes gene_type:complete
LSLLVDDQLQYHPIGLESITESSVGYFDSNWSYQQRSRREVLQLRHIESREVQDIKPTRRLAILVLTDGQQLIGRIKEPGESDEAVDASVINWYSPILGNLAVSLDRIHLMQLAVAQFADQATDDRVQLSNGDMLNGFLLGVTASEIELELGQSQTVTRLPLEQVTAIRLANPLVLPAKPRHRLYLVNGTVLLCDDVLLGRESVTLMDTDWKKITRLPMREIARIDLASKHQQIISLGRQPYTLLGGAQAFGVDFPPSISDQAITMQAPTTLQFTLPKGVTRFAADALINWTQHDPPRARKWTDFTLYLRVDDKPVAELSFNAKSPQHRINLPITPGSKQLSIQITPGLNGPVMDRLRLSEPVLLISD